MKYTFILLAGLMLSACNTDSKEEPKKETGTEANAGKENEKEPEAGADQKEGREAETQTQVGKSGGGTWSKDDRENFIKGCMTQSQKQLGSGPKAEAYCNCMLQKLQIRYKVADSAARMAITEAVEMAQECLPK